MAPRTPHAGVDQPDVSVVLVTRNGAATLPAVLDAIDQQDGVGKVEVVAVDSGSTDGTVALLDARVDRLVQIPPDEFNHGRTRNLAISHSTAPLIVLLVQDAVPAGRRWLHHLTAPLREHDHLAGAFCRQQARADASTLTRTMLARWFATGSAARTVVPPPGGLDRLPPLERLDACTFDNVCSCIRRRVWETHPFADTPIAEDIEWAATVLGHGHAIAYVPDAVVIHSHDRSPRYEFARTYLLHRRLYDLLGVRTIPSLTNLLRAITSSLALHWQVSRGGVPPDGPGATLRSLAMAIAWPAGQYLGALSAAKRWRPLRFRGV